MKKKILIIVFALVVLYLIFRVLPFGFTLKSYTYNVSDGKQTVKLGVPRLSFMSKVNDRSYAYKNIRGNHVLKNEVKDYLNTLEKIECNDTTYYYDKKNDFTVIDYGIKNNILYNTISYDVRYGNYCFWQKAEDYSKKIGGMKRIHGMGDSYSLSPDKEFTPMLMAIFTDDLDEENSKFTAKLEVVYLTPMPDDWRYVLRNEIEKSSGTYEIKDDKLYYTRDKISFKADGVNIPKMSIFKIDEGKLILEDKYLSDYADEVVLEQVVYLDYKDDEAYTKGKMYTFIVIVIIGVIIFICLSIYFSFKALGDDLSKHVYYYVNINDNNKDKIISLLNEEKDNIGGTQDYCDSMYKIEYYNAFPKGTNYTIYCKEKDNIIFSVDKDDEDKLQSYIYDNGDVEKRQWVVR